MPFFGRFQFSFQFFESIKLKKNRISDLRGWRLDLVNFKFTLEKYEKMTHLKKISQPNWKVGDFNCWILSAPYSYFTPYSDAFSELVL